MKAVRRWTRVVLTVLAVAAAFGTIRAQGTVGQPVAPTPHQVVAERVPVLRTTVEDAEALLEQIRKLAALRPPQEAARGERPERAISRLIRLDVPPVVNRGTSFVFRDATERADPSVVQPSGPARSMRDRREAVEAFRRELVRRKQREGAAR